MNPRLSLRYWIANLNLCDWLLLILLLEFALKFVFMVINENKVEWIFMPSEKREQEQIVISEYNVWQTRKLKKKKKKTIHGFQLYIRIC